ncbi:uncharacterized protein AB675_12170 [Cyphellophora attinorum]|uniref:DUF7165 domain-containing protein n=1 Tax=Cyphellophora attinorum TaxID=1664694 RepID=A0A0N1HRB4_9EURO|nr:uncharacterized protein AB675_12170 [Phialophora attinorum]KPI38274.1 hypothetical protein AB675_12170 [Phialophora attinorum]
MAYSSARSISPIANDDTDTLDGEEHNTPQALWFSSFGTPSEASVAAFKSLPPEVIERILYAVDSDGFASLALLNRAWYMQSQKLELYAHHLSRCPSYALSNNVITGPFRRNDLFRLKTKFAAEVRRNLFEAYMRPRRTLVNLISVNTNSSAAIPGGEAFRFAFSPNGQTLLALSSSRVYVLDVTQEDLVVRKELKTLRRPIAASITDDGSLLAVLSSRHQVNIYALTAEGPKHLQVLALTDPPRTIALAHEGTVLAAAYNGSVEVFSLAANALETDRRAVRSEAMDTLQFSGDGSMLVGSSQSLDDPSAVVITAPFYTENDPDLTPREIHSRMWTQQILFPQISSICSHAELLQGHMEGDANWLFAYDHSLMSYRAVRTDDTRSGVAYFLNPSTNRRFSLPSPSTAPSATVCGTLVAAGFAGCGLWLYGVPERLDASPDMGSVVERYEERLRGRVHLTTATGHMEPLMAYSPSVSGSSDEMEGLDSLAQKVDWRQSLFVKCRAIKALDGCSSQKWVERSDMRDFGFTGQRLVAVAPGGVNGFAEDLGDESMPVDGSRICLLDFNYAPDRLKDREITIEVGDIQPELLAEHAGDMAVEVALERRRTVRGGGPSARPNPRAALGRSQTSASPNAGNGYFNDIMPRSSASQPSSPSEGVRSPNMYQPATNLQRSNTAGGFRAARFPPRPPLGQEFSSPPPQQGQGQGEGRRPSQESWETPPPPYSNSGRHTPTSGPFTHQQNWAQLGQFNQAYGTPTIYATTAPAVQPPQGNSGFAAAGNNYLAPRSRGPHLATVSESAIRHNHQTAQPLHRQSPLAMQGFAPSPPDGMPPVMSATVHQPMPSPVSPDIPSISLPAPVVPQQKPAGITLTGANLQNRLNHPVPPAPSDDDQGRRSVSAPLSQNRKEGYAFGSPANNQLSDLERRVDQNRQRALNVVTNGNANHSGSPVPPSPPPGAWGAAGPPSPSFNRALTTPNGPVRPSSHASSGNISIPASSSTPNLHAPGRPTYGRLDTINSIGSQPDHHGHYHHVGPSRMRAHSVAEDVPTPILEQLAGLTGGSGGPAAPPPRVEPDGLVFVPRSRKKKKAKSEGMSAASEWGNGPAEGKKKGSKCVVM